MRCQKIAPAHRFKFKNKLYSLDASSIDLCLSVFPWANFRKIKSAIKLHVGLDHQGYLPAFASITDGKTSDITEGRLLSFPKQNLKIKTFIGTTKNAVMTQVWIAMCTYLLLAFIKFESKTKKSMQQIIRLLQRTLFDKRSLKGLLRDEIPPDNSINPDQLILV